MKRRWLWVALAALLLVPGCSTIRYYAQATQGQMSMLWKARPVQAWIDDAGIPEDLRRRLGHLRQIRDFASTELGLPDNGSYRRYASLGRSFAVWNVVATPEFSTRPREWCFPFAGCVSYKGWFSEAPARAAAEDLRREGLDVVVYGVPAYSTLGWFDDPALDTFIRYPRPELARLLFHELAHQVVYAPGDSTFNESFATAVELAGVQRWLDRHGTPAERDEFALMQRRKADFLGLIAETRKQLDDLYAGPDAPDVMRRRKAEAFAGLRERYESLKRQWGGFAGYDRWFAQPLSNAHLASLVTYHEWVPAFGRLLERHGGDLRALYREAQRLKALGVEARRTELERIGDPQAAGDQPSGRPAAMSFRKAAAAGPSSASRSSEPPPACRFTTSAGISSVPAKPIVQRGNQRSAG